MNKTIRIGLAATAVMLVASCATVDEGPQPGLRVNDANAPYATVQYDRVVIVDKSLQSSRGGKIAIENQGARRTPSGTVEVFATIRNRTDYPLQIEGRVQFFDADKVPVEGPSAWQRVYLGPNSIDAWRESSARTDIAHYYVEIREGR